MIPLKRQFAMSSINVDTKAVFTGIMPIRNSITWTTSRHYFAFASLNDVCFARASCIDDYSSQSIVKTLPLRKPAACLAFAQSDVTQNEDFLVVIDADSQLLVFKVTYPTEDSIVVEQDWIGSKSDLPSDICYARRVGDEHSSPSISHYTFKADVKCFDCVLIGPHLFCAAGCVNGSVYFFDVESSNISQFSLVGLISPFPIPVLNVAMRKIDDTIVCAFNHGLKVTAVRWELASTSDDFSGIKIKRSLTVAGKQYFLSTDSVIGDFSCDICSISFSTDNRRLLIITNDRDFGVYELKPDPENVQEVNWFNLVLGGEASERPFGYCGGCFSPASDKIIIYTSKGALMMFNLIEHEKNFFTATELAPPFTGHLSAISNAEWDPSGSILFTAGTRSREVHAILPAADGNLCQIARPESHQYDIQCFVPLSGLALVVGSDELPFRVYRASSNYVKSINNVGQIDVNTVKRVDEPLPEQPFFKQAVLGVLNVAAGDADKPDDPTDTGIIFDARPTINQLMRYTYWEVAESLYGHANSSSAVAVDANGELLVTSCTGTTSDDAVILVRNLKDYNIRQRLNLHTLTVTQMAFSPDSSMLLSVSRDRSFAVCNQVGAEFKVLKHVSDAHSRMILSCAWAPDSTLFVTGARDSVMSLWTADANSTSAVVSAKVSAPVMALDVAQEPLSNSRWLLAAGLGNGTIEFFAVNVEHGLLEPLMTITGQDGFSLPVVSVNFQRTSTEANLIWHKDAREHNFLLAAGSESGIVKVYSLDTSA